MTNHFALIAVLLLPLLGALVTAQIGRPRAVRRWALGAALATLLATLVLLSLVLWSPFGMRLVPLAGLEFASDSGAALLAVVASLITIGALTFAPRGTLTPRLACTVLIGEAGTLLALLSRSPAPIVIGWAASMLPLLSSKPSPATLRRACVAAVLSTVLLAAALTLDASDGPARALGPFSLLVTALAVAMRAGIPPFHGWAVAVIDRAPLVAAAPTVLSPLTFWVLANALLRSGPVPSWLGAVFVAVGTLGAVYGAIVAMVQHELRRALAYVWVSAISTMLAAIGTLSEPGVVGALLSIASSSLAVSALAFLSSAIDSRTGTCDMRRLGGCAGAMPVASAVFLLCGVTVVGFPGTMGFVSEDLVVQGLVPQHPAVTLVILGAAAINAVTLFRCFKRTFLGPPSDPRRLHEMEDLLPRERALVILWATLLVVGGFVPAPLIALRAVVAHTATHDVATGEAAAVPNDAHRAD